MLFLLSLQTWIKSQQRERAKKNGDDDNAEGIDLFCYAHIFDDASFGIGSE
jgi:hypothetical protein